MRLVLCDDHRLFVEPLAAALSRHGHEVIVTHTPEQAVAAVLDHHPDVVALDLRFPHGDGLDTLATLRERAPGCPVVILSASVDPGDLADAAAGGAAAFLRKDQTVGAITDALARVAAGRPVPTAPMPRRRGQSEAYERVKRLLSHLTDRERQVLALLIQAEETTDIARALGVEASTARTHVQNLLLKLGVHTRLQAVALVIATGLDRELPTPSTARDVGSAPPSAGRPARPGTGASVHARDPRSARR